MQKKTGEDGRVVPKTWSRTDKQTDTLIAILRSPVKGGVKIWRKTKPVELGYLIVVFKRNCTSNNQTISTESSANNVSGRLSDRLCTAIDRRTRKVLVITTRRYSQHATLQRSVKYNCQQLHIVILTTMDGKKTDYWMMLNDTVDMVYYRIKQFRQNFNENQFSSTQIYLVRFK